MKKKSCNEIISSIFLAKIKTLPGTRTGEELMDLLKSCESLCCSWKKQFKGGIGIGSFNGQRFAHIGITLVWLIVRFETEKLHQSGP